MLYIIQLPSFSSPQATITMSLGFSLPFPSRITRPQLVRDEIVVAAAHNVFVDVFVLLWVAFLFGLACISSFGAAVLLRGFVCSFVVYSMSQAFVYCVYLSTFCALLFCFCLLSYLFAFVLLVSRCKHSRGRFVLSFGRRNNQMNAQTAARKLTLRVLHL